MQNAAPYLRKCLLPQDVYNLARNEGAAKPTQAKLLNRDQHSVSTRRGYKDVRVTNRRKIGCGREGSRRQTSSEVQEGRIPEWRLHKWGRGGGKGLIGELGWGGESRAVKSRRVPAGAWSSTRNWLSRLIKIAKGLKQSLVLSTLGETEVDGDLGVGEEREAKGNNG